MVAQREYLVKVCTDFLNSGLSDPKFLTELSGGSNRKFWACVTEALIAERLADKCFGLRTSMGEGPDFLVMSGTRKIWVEVVCPEPTNLSLDWLAPALGEAVTFPHEAILLRWTSAIKAKAEKLIGSEDGRQTGYLGSGLVAPEDSYVIAVNGYRLRGGAFPALAGITQFPFAVEAVFPVGPYQVRFDRDKLNVIDCGHRHRPFIFNHNDAKVSTLTFLDKRFSAISAVWAVDLSGASAIGNSEPSGVIHNPTAINPVPPGFLPADHEYFAVVEKGSFAISRTCMQSTV